MVAILGMAVSSTSAIAQTLPLRVPVVPAEPAEPAPDAETAREPELTPSANQPPPGPPIPLDAGEASRSRVRPWEYAFGMGLAWDGNIDFLSPDGPSDAAVAPRAALARVFSGPHRRLRATAAGRWAGYRERTDLRRAYADFGLDASVRPSPGTRWRASASYGLGDSASSRILLAQGAALPRVRTRSLAGALGLTRRAGAWTSLRFDARYYSTAFDTPGLIDGQSVRATLGVDRQLSTRTATSIEYSLEDALSGREGGPYTTHFASLQWSRVLSPRSALLLEAGASYTPDAARAGLERKDNFFGGASFTRTFMRSSLALFLRHEVTPAFGLGRSRVDLRAGLGGTIPVGRAWVIRTFATHLEPRKGVDGERVNASGDDAFVAWGRRLGRRLELSGEARYRRVGATSRFPEIEGFQAGLFLTLQSPAGGDLSPH